MLVVRVGQRTFEWRQVRVGGLIILGLLLLGYAIYRVGMVMDVFARRYEIVTLVPSALGLREGAPVTLAGQRIGQVQRIEFIPVHQKTGGNNLRVVLAIAEEVREQVRIDSRAFLRTQGLLGDKFVDISPGSSGARIMQPGDTILAGRSVDMDEFITQAAEALDDATGIVTNLQELTGGLTRGEGTVGRLLRDEQLYDNVNAATAELRRTLAEVNRADGTIGRLVRDPALYHQLHGAVARVDSLGALLLHSQGTLGMLLRSDTLHRAVLSTIAGADAAVGDIGEFLRRMTEGDGTVQRLMTDPALYDEFLRAVVDVQTLVNDIRLNPAKYKPNIMVDIF
jgi:phospholipid/cholesterol/gamma-HCH transport system substrate-binding protein